MAKITSVNTPYKGRENRLHSFVLAVLARPTMYTMGGSYAEVVAFLEGYFSGVAHGQSQPRETDPWTAFGIYLSPKYGNENRSVFAAFADKHGTASFDMLRDAYVEFSSTPGVSAR